MDIKQLGEKEQLAKYIQNHLVKGTSELAVNTPTIISQVNVGDFTGFLSQIENQLVQEKGKRGREGWIR